MKIVLFMGYQGGGKTTAIERVSSALVRAGLTVGTLKHIHDPGFTIDTPGKDTWRHTRAGAEVVVALSAHELAVILKRDTAKMPLEKVFDLFEKEHVDYLLIEGLYRGLGEERRLIRILCAEDEEHARRLLRSSKGEVACITGKVAEVLKGRAYRGVPLIRLPRDMSTLLKLMKVSNLRT